MFTRVYRGRRGFGPLLATVALTAIASLATPSLALAATQPNLGTATGFAVLAGSTVTNTGPSVITGDLGVSPGAAVTGFPPGTVTGAQHKADAIASPRRHN
jgi:Ice-binding-like